MHKSARAGRIQRAHNSDRIYRWNDDADDGARRRIYRAHVYLNE